MMAILSLVLLILSVSHPHKLCAKAEVLDNQLRVEAWFDNDEPAEGAKVRLLQGTTVVQEGIADDRGLCFLKVPPTGTYVIDVNAGGGHRTEVNYALGDVAAGDSKEAVQDRRWWGALAGLVVIVGLTLMARHWLRLPAEAQRR
jgi:hypothetical protein